MNSVILKIYSETNYIIAMVFFFTFLISITIINFYCLTEKVQTLQAVISVIINKLI